MLAVRKTLPYHARLVLLLNRWQLPCAMVTNVSNQQYGIPYVRYICIAYFYVFECRPKVQYGISLLRNL